MSKPLLAVYAATRKSGFLRTRAGDALFNRAYFAYKRLLEDPFAKLIRNRPELFRGGHVIDVGANIGYTTVLFAKALEEPYRVIAFEPEEENFRRLQRNVARHGVSGRVELIRSAVGDREGTVSLSINEDHPGDHRVIEWRTGAPPVRTGEGARPPLEVPVTTLDSLAIAPVAFVKIDVQGYEPAVLAGMSRLVDTNPNITIAVEVCPEALAGLGYTESDITRPLEEHGFAAEKISDNRDYWDLIWRRPGSAAGR